MRIAVMGTGAVGGYFGAKLANAGHDVTFIARGAHLEAIRAKGLSVLGPHGDMIVREAKATDDPAKIDPVDVVLFTVKLYDTESAARSIAPLVEKGGVCISLQNGVDAQDRIAKIIGADKVMGGLAFVSGVIETPGVIRYTSNMSSLRYGEPDGSMSARATAFRDAGDAAGFKAELMPDIRAAQWQKFVGLATNAAMCGLVRKPVGVIYNDPDLIPIAQAAFEEVAAVARAQGIAMPADVGAQELKRHQTFPPGMYASMYHDLARGRPIEIDSFSGHIMRKGREYGVPTPVHTMAYACLKPYINGA
jgi:2-dehydropantoate 2-reductase